MYVTTSNKNNGVSGTSIEVGNKGGVITVDSATEGKSFYQEHDFIGSDHVEVLTPCEFTMNRFRAMFVITMMNFNSFRYGFGRKRAQKRLKTEKILLPIVDKNHNEIDWELIERYIKQISFSENLN